MVGRELADIYPPKAGAVERGRPVLEVEGLSAGDRVRDVSFQLYPGEVLGIAGLVGAGRTILAHALFGSLPWTSGVVRLDGAPVPAGGAGRCDRARRRLPDRGSPGRRPAPEPPDGAQHHAARARPR